MPAPSISARRCVWSERTSLHLAPSLAGCSVAGPSAVLCLYLTSVCWAESASRRNLDKWLCRVTDKTRHCSLICKEMCNIFSISFKQIFSLLTGKVWLMWGYMFRKCSRKKDIKNMYVWMTNQILIGEKVHSHCIDILFDVSLCGTFGKNLWK